MKKFTHLFCYPSAKADGNVSSHISYLIIMAFCFLPFSAMAQITYSYSIEKGDAEFLVFFEGSTHSDSFITIQDAIDHIKNDASGEDCIIQFENGINTLDIGADKISFDGGPSGTDWGAITLKGKLTSAYNSTPDTGSIYITNEVSLICEAIILNTADDGIAIYNHNETVTINEGAVSATGSFGVAVYCNGGKLIINGGTVSTIDGSAIFADCSKIEISDGVISASASATENGNAIHCLYTEIIMTGGMILATEGYAINNEEGAIYIINSIVFAYGTVIYDIVFGYNYASFTDYSVVAAWDSESSTLTYDAGTPDDIMDFSPMGISTAWGKRAGISGIVINNHDYVTGFIPIEGVTVEGTDIVETHCNASLQVYPNPTTGELRIMNNEQLIMNNVEIYDVYGKRMEIPRFARNDGGAKFPSNSLEGWQPQADGVVLNISHLANGVYFLKINTENSAVVKKIVKQSLKNTNY